MPKAKVVEIVPRGTLVDWNHKLDQMPVDGEFEVMRIHSRVYRWDAESRMVVDPATGRMFRPIAWRPKQ